jgi:hypothetical protein
MAPPSTAPPDTWGERLRDKKRSLASLSNPRYWLITRGAWVGIAFGLLYAVGGMVLGWTVAYEVLVAITSPADTSCPPLAWVLSLAGWLLVPAFVGGVTGYLVNRQVDNRRRESAEEAIRRMQEESGPPRSGGGTS